jgi:uncharacterized protein YeaO (DUF488 family)
MNQPAHTSPGRATPIEVVRVHEDAGRRPGDHRVLVDRLWPRGIPKAALDLDEWAKDAAPSTDLRRWYGHEPARFVEFSRRYRAELERDPGASAVERLRALAGGHDRLVLLTATRDVEHSGATVLAEVLAGTPGT